MTPEVWQRVSALYSAALRLPTEERLTFAEEATRGEPELRRELVEMIGASAPEADFLEHPPLRISPTGLAASQGAPPKFSEGELVCGGRFRVEQQVGRGGMGRVYRAVDVELGRVVALKTVAVPAALAETGAKRLRHEASLVSQLNHPNICTLYDLWRYDGLDVAVMEFVEGETLSTRLARTGMSQDAAIQTVLEVLDALDYAHRHDVVHRDVKPSNVILTRTGAKLLDFGIAKAWRAGARSATASNPELTPGTPAYMAPEQLARLPVDARADLYSVGVMLCEMLTRRPGEKVAAPANAETIGNPLLRRVLARCLAQDPDRRWQTAADLRAALELAQFSAATEPVPAPVPKSRPWMWVTAALVLAAGAWSFWPGAAAGPAAPIQFRLGPPSGTEFPPVERAGPPAISPDGALIAMVARDAAGESHLWLRHLDNATPVELPQTEGASHPFWSPDSRQIAFFARGKLRAVPAQGGTPRVICDAAQGRGGTWSDSDVIVFAPSLNDALYRVAAAGGVAAPVTYLDRPGEENSHRWPAFVAGTERLLFVVRSSSESRSGLFLTSLDGDKPVKVGSIASSAVFVPDRVGAMGGHLLFTDGSQVLAQPFDAGPLTLSGEPRTVAELAWNDTTTSRAPISASASGILVYGGGYPETFHLAWHGLAASGAARPAEPMLDPGGAVRFLRLSPDARTAAIERLDFRTGSGSIWLIDTMRGGPERLTFGSVAAYAPVWSRDGRSMVYTATPGGRFEITSVLAQGGRWQEAERKVLLSFPSETPAIATDFAPDGSVILEMRGARSGWDIVAAKPGAAPAAVRSLAAQPSDERQARVSPDGAWLAYVSNESGANQVYLTPLAGAGQRISVSLQGGTQPIWGRGSNELYFVGGDRKLMHAEIDYAQRLARTSPAGGPVPQLSIQGLMSGWEYGIGDRVVFAGVPAPRGSAESVFVLEGWRQQLIH